MERKAFTSLTEASMRVLLGETHMIGKTVIVKGKKGNVIKQVGSDGDTESDEIYKVKFEDGTVEDIPARDMEMQGDDNKKIGENELEDIVKEDNTAATAKAVRKHLKNKYPEHKIHVRSKGGKTRFIQATSDQGFGNDTRKGILSHSSPNAKVTNPDDISYGNVSKNIISASTDHWASHIGLTEAYRPTPVSPGSRYPTQQKKTKKTNAHSGIPGMSKKGKGILASMTNSFETSGGPHIDHDNIHNLTHHSVNQTIKMAHKHLEDNPHPEASKQLSLIKKELGESVEPKPKKQHGIKSDPAYKQARTSRQIKKARDQYNLRNPEDPWVGESVEVNEIRISDIPADKKTKDWIQSGRAKILMSTDSTLGGGSQFVIVNNFRSGAGQDKVLMAIISDPDKGRIKMFSYHGSNANVKGAMKFAKNNKLVTGWIHSESVEIDEATKTAKFNRLADRLDQLRRDNLRRDNQ
jgi:hypothetical protein